MIRVWKFAAGQKTARTTLPGDFVLTHRDELPSKLIALGQARRFRGKEAPYAHWSHVACVEDARGGLVEALGHGVERGHIDRYQHVEYHYVRVEASNADREQMAAFLAACVGRGYGYLEIVSLGLALLCGGDYVAFGSPGTLICSGLGAQMLTRAGAIFDRDPNRCMPADLARWAGALPE